MVRNTYIYPPAPSMRIVADIIAYTAQRMPKFNSISISGYHIQEAGANQALELAFTLADGREYVRLALARGMDVDEFAGRLSFFFGIGMNFYLEIAKLRAARLLWWRIMQAFSPKSPKSLMLRTHCQTSGWSLTEQDPYNNIVRTTIEAMAAVFGGTQSLHTNSFDEAIALPSDFAARIARNTQVLLQEETHITNVIDPWGGSYMMERAHAGHGRQGVGDPRGDRGHGRHDPRRRVGLGEAQDRGVRRGEAGAHRRGSDVIVGVNKWKPDRARRRSTSARSTTPPCANRRSSASRRSARRATRCGVAASLAALTEAARSGEGNLLDLAIRAVRARATVGEISGALESVWGRHRATTQSVSGVYGANFAEDAMWEKLRADIDAFARDEGRRPRIMVAKLGQDGHDRGVEGRRDPRSPTWASTSTSARCSRRRKRPRARRSRTTCTRWACPRSPPATRRSCPR